MFFRTLDGGSFPLSRVKRWSDWFNVDQDGRSQQLQKVELDNGMEFEVERCEVTRAVRATSTCITAQPGTYFLWINPLTDQGMKYQKVPVLAWCLEDDTSLLPITQDGVQDFDDAHNAVLLPDGAVLRDHRETWPTLDAFLSSVGFAGEDV